MEYYKIICWTECPFCLKAKNLLMEKNKQFEYCSIDHSRQLLDYYKLISIVKKAGYNGFIGVEYEGEILSEKDGVIATKKLLEKAAKML